MGRSCTNKVFDYINAGLPIISERVGETIMNLLNRANFKSSSVISLKLRQIPISCRSKSANVVMDSLDIRPVSSMEPYATLIKGL